MRVWLTGRDWGCVCCSPWLQVPDASESAVVLVLVFAPDCRLSLAAPQRRCSLQLCQPRADMRGRELL